MNIRESQSRFRLMVKPMTIFSLFIGSEPGTDHHRVPLVELPRTSLPSVPFQQYCNLDRSRLQYFCLLREKPVHLQEPGRIALLTLSFCRSSASQARLSLFFSPHTSPSLFLQNIFPSKDGEMARFVCLSR